MIEKIEEFLNSLGYSLDSTWTDKGQGYKFIKREPSSETIMISVFMGNKGRQTISKVDADSNMYNNYVEFTPTELKFFDILDFEVSHWHNDRTGQDIVDWIDAAKIELEY